jgi:hypothetical protein
MKNIIRVPSQSELEKLRLLLSTYQNGTGQLATEEGSTLPGWRDFERAAALAFGGEAQESKAIFDVLIPDPARPGLKYGLSCKMRGELNRIDKDGRVTIELSNSAGEFWDHLRTKGINQTNYKSKPMDVGVSLIEVIRRWHEKVDSRKGGNVDIAGSSYLVLSWNRKGWYQLHQFPLELPDPTTLKWYFPKASVRHLNGDDSEGSIFEWYGESGGQLKYYPLARNAVWSSARFRLESGKFESILDKVARYFSEQWEKAQRL